MGGESVAQGMWMDPTRHGRLVHPAVEDVAHRAVGETAAAPEIEEDRLALLADVLGARAHALPNLQPLPQGIGRRPAEGDHALLVPFPSYPQHARRQVDRLPVEADQLADAQAGGIEQL